MSYNLRSRKRTRGEDAPPPPPPPPLPAVAPDEFTVSKDDITCPVCFDPYSELGAGENERNHYDRRPMIVCSNGHTVCKSCSQMIRDCPICRAHLLTPLIPEVTLLTIVRRLPHNHAPERPADAPTPPPRVNRNYENSVEEFENGDIETYDIFEDMANPTFNAIRTEIVNRMTLPEAERRSQKERIAEMIEEAEFGHRISKKRAELLRLLLGWYPINPNSIGYFNEDLYDILYDIDGDFED